MAKLLARRPLQQRPILLLYLGTAAVAVIAVAALHFTVAASLTAQRDTVVLLDLLREQQSLAQRIAYLVARAAEGDRASEFQRGQVTSRFARTHEQWRHADGPLGVSASSAAAFRALYAGGDRPLAADVQNFLSRVRAAEGDAQPNPRGIEESQAITRFAGEAFPNGLDSIAKSYLRAYTAKTDALGWIQVFLCGSILLGLLTQGLAIAWPMWRRLRAYDEESTAIGVTDPATGALTAQSFTKRAIAEIRRARRYRRPVSVMTIAPDTAAGIADTEALQTLYGNLSETLRPSDFVGALDGGAFSLILPETDLYAAELAGHRILRELDKRRHPVDGRAGVIDVRIGVAQVRADEALPDEPLARAMAALHGARVSEGDRVAVSPAR